MKFWDGCVEYETDVCVYTILTRNFPTNSLCFVAAVCAADMYARKGLLITLASRRRLLHRSALYSLQIVTLLSFYFSCYFFS